MKTKQLLTYTTCSALALLVAACGSPSVEGEAGPNLAAALPNQSESAQGTPYVAISDEELGWRADVPETATANLQVEDSFDFATSRNAQVDMNVPAAASVEAEATFCTNYTKLPDDTYEVDYNSCVLQAPLNGGVLSEQISLVNQHASVLAVVWFQDESMQPMYQEFHFE